jgi:GAF domain-containing protein/ActR/RegA family two-component response regulator
VTLPPQKPSDRVRDAPASAHHAERMYALADLGRLLSETLDPHTVGQRAVDSVGTLLSANSAAIYRLDSESGYLHELAHSRDTTPPFEWTPLVPPGMGIAGFTAHQRTPVTSPDSLDDPRFTFTPDMRARIERSPYRAFMGVPLLAKERLLGILVAGAQVGRIFSDAEVHLAQGFADQTALALENARLFDDAARRGREAELVAELSRTINASRDLDTILPRLVEGARDLCAGDFALIALRPVGAEEAAARCWVGATQDYRDVVVRPGRGIGGVALASGQSRRTRGDRNELGASEEYRELARQEGLLATMEVPIPGEDRVEGVLFVARRTRHAFTDRDESTITQLAEHAAIAIRNVRLYERLEERARETREYADRLRALDEVNRLVSSSLRIDEVLANLVAAVARFFDAPTAAVWRLDVAAGHVYRAVTHADSELDAELPRQYALGEGGVGWVILHGQPILWSDLTKDDRLRGVDVLRRKGLRYVCVYPIALGERVLGAFTFCRAEPAMVTAETVSLLGSLAAQAAVALDNARLYTDTARHLDHSRALLDVVRLLNSTLDSKRLLKEVAIKIAQVCGADRCSVSSWDGEAMIPLMSQFADGHTQTDLWKTFVRMSPSRLTDLRADVHAVTERRTIVIDDAGQSPDFARAWAETFDIGPYLVTPLIRRDQVIGVMNLVGVRGSLPFQPWQVELAEAIAGQLALAMANVRLFEEARDRLRETQVLLAVADILSAGGPSHEVMRRVAREVARALGADMVGVYDLDAQGDRLSPVAGYHVPPALRQTFMAHPIILGGVHEVCEAWQAGRAVWSSDIESDPRFRDALAKGLGSAATLFAPIMIRGRAEGAIFAVWWRSGRVFPPSEIRLLEAVASHAGAAVENARLFEENRRQVEELTVLHELARALTGQFERAAVLEAILSLVPRVFAAPSMVLVVPPESGDGLEVVARRIEGLEPAVLPVPCPEGPAGGLKRVIFTEGRTIRTNDYAGECARRGVHPDPAAARFPCWMGVPLRVGDSVLGAVGVGRADRAFTEADQRLLTNIAGLAALALRSVALFEERTRAYGELAAAQDQLVRTEKLRALGEMASGVAHDFNNLLTAILGRAELALREVGDPRLRQWLQVIERSALDGAQTVRRLQEFTRIRRDQPFVPIDLNRIACEALELTQSRWRDDTRRRDVTIHARTALATLPSVVGDPAELREALTNIILNAVDAMPEGGLLTLATSATGGEVCLTVSDTGVGMSAAVRRRIFDPFFTTKGPQGTGLGLSMTYGIVSRHGARMEVDTEEGRGSTFRLIFKAAPTPLDAAPAAPEVSTSTSTLNCLVVDDEEQVGALLGDILESVGHRAVVCIDGADAVARFRSERYDVVFTDLAMPGLSGWQVARTIKAIEPDVPVFIVTGFGVELSAEERRANGVDAVLAKPLRVQEILDVAARVARGRGRGEVPGQGRVRWPTSP